MSNPEEDIKKTVNVKKVVKAVKDIGHFAMFSPNEDTNLLLTGHFALNFNEDQAWEIQCALLVKNRGMWLYTNKEGLQEGKPVTTDQWATYARAIKNLDLEIIGRTNLYLDNIAIYITNGGKYVGIKQNYIEMINTSAMKQAPVSIPIIAGDIHSLMPVSNVKSEYLAVGMSYHE
jgi:hypothetical protein